MLYGHKLIFKRCFYYRPRYWYKNIKYIPLYFKQIYHLLKYGYDEGATWETFDWFIENMRAILTDYRKHHSGFVVTDENLSSDSNAALWDATIDRMIELLNLMDEANPKYDADEYHGVIDNINRQYDEMNAAKDEFFALFSKYFYHLWD